MPIKMDSSTISVNSNTTPGAIKKELELREETSSLSHDTGVLMGRSTNEMSNGGKLVDEHEDQQVANGEIEPLKVSAYDAVVGANDQELAKRQYVDDDDDVLTLECLPKKKRFATASSIYNEANGLHANSNGEHQGDRNDNQNRAPSEEYSGNNKHSAEPEQMRKLFIGGLDWKTSEDTLKRHFEKFGEVIDCVVMRDPQTKRSRGFGFVIYATSAMVDRAQEARPHEVDGREVQPKRAISREDSGRPEAEATVKKVYLGGLSDDIEESELRDYFKEFGNIVNINIVAHKDTGKRRGFAFIEYDDWDPVDKIVLKKFHTIKDKRVEAKKAIPKIEMDARKRVDPRSVISGVMLSMGGGLGGGPPTSTIDGPARGGRGIGRGNPVPPSYLCYSPYGASFHQGYSTTGMDGYGGHYPSAHYGAGWMVHANQATAPYSFRGSHAAGAYSRGSYAGQTPDAVDLTGWPEYGGFSPSVASPGAGPMRHLANYQHRGYRPYANGSSYGLGSSNGGNANGSSISRGGRGYNP